MRDFQLPIDFNPTYRKDYTERNNGIHYEVWVQNKGLQKEKAGQAPHLLWIFVVWAKGRMVEAGPFRWDPSERELTDENVCNNVATFYGDSEQVRMGKPNRRLQPSGLLDELVEKCRAYMFKTYYEPSGTGIDPGYTIHTAVIDDGSWEIMLSMHTRPNMMYRFRSMDLSKVEVSCHVKAYVNLLDTSEL